MKSFYKKQFSTVALIWTACFILFLFVYMFILAPQSKNSKRVEMELAEMKLQYQAALKATDEEAKTQLRNKIGSLQNKLGGFVVEREDCGNLTLDISRIANAMGITTFSIQSKDKGRIFEIPDCNYIFENAVEISFTSEFDKFAMFLNAMERYHPVIFVDSFTIENPMQQEEPGKRVKMSTVVFVMKEQSS